MEPDICNTKLTKKHRNLCLLMLCSIAIILLFLIYFNYVTFAFYLHQMTPKVEIHVRNERCCVQDDAVDMCGRSDCLWPCPASVNHQLSLRPNVPNQQQAFLLETSGSSHLDFRQACSVESLAYRNPNLTVHLLMTGENTDRESVTMKTLQENYPNNLKITNIDLSDYVDDTPLAQWYFCSEWNRGWFAVAHLSDALRLLTLFKFGGYYFDLDVVHLRPVTSYRNFFVEDDGSNNLANGIIHADYQHPLIQTAVEEFASKYRWYIWANNGPDLITRIMRAWCDIDDIRLMTSERCRGFRVLQSKSFFPVGVKSPETFFIPRQSSNDEKESFELDESVIGAHVWNKLTADLVVYKKSKQLYARLARSSCPLIFQAAPDKF